MQELTTIQNLLKAPKGQFNAYGKYNYRSCEDILEAVKPLLYQEKCNLVLSDDIASTGNHSRVYIKAVATITNAEGQTVTVRAFAREPESKKGMDPSQITGTASSYARKYALNGLFAIDDTKDSDMTNEQPAPEPTAPKFTKEQIITALNKATSIEVLEEKMLKVQTTDLKHDADISRTYLACRDHLNGGA